MFFASSKGKCASLGFQEGRLRGGAAELCHPAGWPGSKQCAPCLQHYLLFLSFPKPLLPKKVEAFEPAPDTADSCPQQEKKIKKKLIPPRWLEAGSQRGRAALPAAWSCPQPAPARPRDLRLQPWGRVRGRRERGPAAGGSPRRAANPLSVLQGAPRGALPSSCWCCWCWAHGQRRRRRVSAGSRDTVTVPTRVPGGGVGSAGEEEEEEGGIFC